MVEQMNMYEVEFSESGPNADQAKLLVSAVSQEAADEWAEAHGKAHGLELVAKSKPVRDLADWQKRNRSVDLGNKPDDFHGNADVPSANTKAVRK